MMDPHHSIHHLLEVLRGDVVGLDAGQLAELAVLRLSPAELVAAAEHLTESEAACLRSVVTWPAYVWTLPVRQRVAAIGHLLPVRRAA